MTEYSLLMKRTSWRSHTLLSMSLIPKRVNKLLISKYWSGATGKECRNSVTLLSAHTLPLHSTKKNLSRGTTQLLFDSWWEAAVLPNEPIDNNFCQWNGEWAPLQDSCLWIWFRWTECLTSHEPHCAALTWAQNHSLSNMSPQHGPPRSCSPKNDWNQFLFNVKVSSMLLLLCVSKPCEFNNNLPPSGFNEFPAVSPVCII